MYQVSYYKTYTNIILSAFINIHLHLYSQTLDCLFVDKLPTLVQARLLLRPQAIHYNHLGDPTYINCIFFFIYTTQQKKNVKRKRNKQINFVDDSPCQLDLYNSYMI